MFFLSWGGFVFFMIIFLNFVHMNVLPTYMYAYMVSMEIRRGHPLELESQISVNCHVSAGNGIPGLCKSSKRSSLLSPISPALQLYQSFKMYSLCCETKQPRHKNTPAFRTNMYFPNPAVYFSLFSFLPQTLS